MWGFCMHSCFVQLKFSNLITWIIYENDVHRLNGNVYFFFQQVAHWDKPRCFIHVHGSVLCWLVTCSIGETARKICPEPAVSLPIQYHFCKESPPVHLIHHWLTRYLGIISAGFTANYSEAHQPEACRFVGALLENRPSRETRIFWGYCHFAWSLERDSHGKNHCLLSTSARLLSR